MAIHPSSSQPHSRGFSLIELLVVISIVAALAGVLLPAAMAVRGQVRNLQCANNLRMLVMASMTYATDNDSTLPYFFEPHDSRDMDWYGMVNPYLDDTYQGNSNNQRPSAFHCPLAQIEVQNQSRNVNQFAVHYSMNQDLRAWWNWQAVDWVNGLKPVPLSRTRPDQVLFNDAVFLGSNQGTVHYFSSVSPDYVGGWWWGPWPIGGNVNGFDDAPVAGGSFPILRHRGRINQACIDGHVEAVSGIWNQAEQTARRR